MLANTIKNGDTIGIVSPSHVAEKERYARFFSAINSLGFNVKEGKTFIKIHMDIWHRSRNGLMILMK
jgi:muramoyltetrapeptide carboxypeptidase LdcA involved in peptidoglycan recycling